MKNHGAILYEETLSSSVVTKIVTTGASLIGVGFIFVAWALFITGESYGVVSAVFLFALLFLASVGSEIKKVMTNGGILVTSDGLKLTHGRQEVYLAREEIIQFQKKTLEGFSRTPHVFENEDDPRHAIACQVFPNALSFPYKGIFLLAKHTKPSSGGLFGSSISSELPFFIPTHRPEDLLSALQKISSFRDKNS
ncbi:hypothetical protein KBB27_01415 [Patescibacteria group bacterium]|nr:hypothetical protein [Patescibacteria group bacterium]